MSTTPKILKSVKKTKDFKTNLEITEFTIKLDKNDIEYKNFSQNYVILEYDFELLWLIECTIESDDTLNCRLTLKSCNSNDIFIKIITSSWKSFWTFVNSNDDTKKIFVDELSTEPSMSLKLNKQFDYLKIDIKIYSQIKYVITSMGGIAKSYKDLRKNEESSDVTIYVGDEEYFAHKLILSTRSPVFAAMFKTDMKEKEEDTVEIEDVEPEVFELLLEFIYTGKFGEDHDEEDDSIDWLELMTAADEYDIADLKNICARRLASNLSVDDVIDIYILSDRIKEQQLKKTAANFIILNKSKIVSTEKYKELIQMIKSNADLAVELVQEFLENKNF